MSRQEIVKASYSGEIKRLISNRQTFRITDVVDTSTMVASLEKDIESRSLKCRVYTSKRSAGLVGALIPTGITQLTALGTAISIGVHNLCTFNPDYEIVKYVSGDIIDVVYKK